MKRAFEIESDCLDIVKRIKEIDKDYFVMFNLDNGKFELHHRGQLKKTYCLTLPYDTLDERSVLYVLKTRVQNSDKIFKEIDEANKRLEKARVREVFNALKEGLYDS